MQINITDQTAKAITLLDDRYYFDLFKSIRTDIEEEYIIRDAINAIAKEIRDNKSLKQREVINPPHIVLHKKEQNPKYRALSK